MKVAGKTSQFEMPRGFGGRMAGHVMALWNMGINRLVLEMLDVQPRDHVLEIGFGPGTLVTEIARYATLGFVAGIDRSPTMLAQARRRNRRLIEGGRVELRLGDISRIPYPDKRFDKVCTVNTIYFWPTPMSDAGEIARVLKDDGIAAVAFRGIETIPKTVSARVGMAGYDAARAIRLLENAGFHSLRSETRRFALMTAVCVVARK